jgi:hypothetical protein
MIMAYIYAGEPTKGETLMRQMETRDINFLHQKAYGGNLALKLDISKAFHTLDWTFLLKVLRNFGFCEKLCKWIEVILHSAKFLLSFLISLDLLQGNSYRSNI